MVNKKIAIEVHILKGLNQFSIKVEEVSRDIIFEDLIDNDSLDLYEPRLYSLFVLKVY
jgi:hypothetical protein